MMLFLVFYAVIRASHSDISSFQVNLLETEIEEVVSKVIELVGPLQAKLKRKKFKGAEILLKKLTDLKV